jgi:hypothetical protein
VSANECGFAAGILASAFRELESSSASSSDRAHAASVVRRVSELAPLNELQAADLMNVLTHRLAETGVVCSLLRALRSSEDGAKLAAGMERLAGKAHQLRLLESLVRIVISMQGLRCWSKGVRDDWVWDALGCALSEGWVASGRRILRGWLDRHEGDRVPGPLRALIERYPILLASGSTGCAHSWRLHGLFRQ